MTSRKSVTATRKPDRGMSALAKKGLRIRRELIGPENIDAWQAKIAGNDFMKMFFDFTHEFCFGAVWGRPALDYKTRDMLTLAILAAKGQAGGVKRHVRSALRVGLTKREIGEILLHVYGYAGVYASLSSFTAAAEEFAVIEQERKEARRAKAKAKRKASRRR
jgi:4-carboxymuconolactone decarboxylase